MRLRGTSGNYFLKGGLPNKTHKRFDRILRAKILIQEQKSRASEEGRNMPAYHSKKNEDGDPEVCSCAMCPLQTDLKGPAAKIEAGKEDIIDETITNFRANVLFRNFDVRGGADRTLIYLTLHACQCLVRCERIEDKPSALRELKALSANKPFAIPGESAFPVGALFSPPATKTEGDQWRAYFKQAREELAIRLCDRLFDADGSKNKWWQACSKKKFMGKELRDY